MYTHTQQYQASSPLARLEIGMGVIFVVFYSPDPAADDDAKVVLVHLFFSLFFSKNLLTIFNMFIKNKRSTAPIPLPMMTPKWFLFPCLFNFIYLIFFKKGQRPLSTLQHIYTHTYIYIHTHTYQRPWSTLKYIYIHTHISTSLVDAVLSNVAKIRMRCVCV
jgi:hypothetical protein